MLAAQPVLVELTRGSWSFVAEFGPVKAVKVFAPGPGRIHTPRWSRLLPSDSTPSQLSTSAMNRVLDVPSARSVILLPFPSRPPTGYLSILTVPNAPSRRVLVFSELWVALANFPPPKLAA